MRLSETNPNCRWCPKSLVRDIYSIMVEKTQSSGLLLYLLTSINWWGEPALLFLSSLLKKKRILWLFMSITSVFIRCSDWALLLEVRAIKVMALKVRSLREICSNGKNLTKIFKYSVNIPWITIFRSRGLKVKHPFNKPNN